MLLAGAGFISTFRGRWSFLGCVGFAPTLEILGMGTGTLVTPWGGTWESGHLSLKTQGSDSEAVG